MKTRLKVLGLLVGTMAALSLRSTAQAETLFVSRATFLAALTASVTDGYDSPPYAAGFSVLNDAPMSAVFGETQYTSTSHGIHIITGGTYCAGCNGSFRLTFTATSVGTPAGVHAVGVDILGNSAGLPYHAFVTYEDATTLDIALPAGGSFFGITSVLRIQSIHFGLANGASTTAGSFQIDNLTIGAIVTDVTPPTVSCAVARPVLGFVTGGMFDVGLAVQAADDLGQVTVDVAVYSDEDVGAAPYAPDASWDGAVLRLRAERLIGGAANGRVYLIVVTATDGAGNTAKSFCTVVVPLRLTTVNLLQVNAEAAAAKATAIATQLPPAGYFPL